MGFLKLKMMNKFSIYLTLILIGGLSSLAWAGTDNNPVYHENVILPETGDTQPIIKPHLEDAVTETIGNPPVFFNK